MLQIENASLAEVPERLGNLFPWAVDLAGAAAGVCTLSVVAEKAKRRIIIGKSQDAIDSIDSIDSKEEY